MRTILTNLKQAIFCPGFFVSTVSVAIILFFSSTEIILAAFRADSLMPYGFHADFVMSALSSDAVALVLPIIAALPSTASFVDDIKSGFIKAYLPRTSTTRYIVGKATGCASSGGLALALGILIAYAMAALVFLPMEATLPLGTEPPKYLEQLLEILLMFFASGAFWSLVGLTLATATNSKYMAYASPFVIFYLFIILYERYFNELYVLYPREWLNPSDKWPFGRVSVATLLIELTILMGLGFACAANRRLKQL